MEVIAECDLLSSSERVQASAGLHACLAPACIGTCSLRRVHIAHTRKTSHERQTAFDGTEGSRLRAATWLVENDYLCSKRARKQWIRPARH